VKSSARDDSRGECLEGHSWLRDKEQQVFKTIELGAWYRIRWEGKSVPIFAARTLGRVKNA